MNLQHLDRARALIGRLVVGVATALLLLWFVAPQVLRPILLDQAPTRPTAALGFLLLGVVLGFRLRRAVNLVLLSVVALLALEGALAGLLGLAPVSADLLHLDAWRAVEPTGKMTLSAALVLLSLAAAVVLSPGRPRAAAVLGVAAFGIAFVNLIGHLYGATTPIGLHNATFMVLPTVPVALASAAAVLLHPSLPTARALAAPGTAGALLRRHLGWSLATPPAVGWLVVHGQRSGWFEALYGDTLLVLVLTFGTVITVVQSARTAARGEHARTAILDRGRLQHVLDRTPVGIFETDAGGRRRYVNSRWRELAGLTAEDTDVIDGAAWGSVVHPEDRDRVAGEWAAALAEGREYAGRYRYLRPDGAVTWVDTVASAIRAADGTVTRWLGSVTDVTAQVEVAQRLEESERRYRSVVATMAEGVVLQDPDGRILTANDAACRVLGLEMAQLLGRRTMDPRWHVVRDDGSEYPFAERPTAVALATGRPVRGASTGVYRSDGTLAWLEVSAEPLLESRADGTSVVVGAVTTFTDVTAQRAASRALARSEEQFRSAMAHAPVGMALVGLDGAFTEVNRALCRLLGYDEAALVGRTFQELTHPDDLGSDLELLNELKAGNVDHYTLEKRYLDSDGEVVWVSLAVSMARDEDDQPAYYIAQLQDITVARAARQSLAHRALHDPLTGLANRDLLMDRLSHALSRSARTGVSTVVLFCDLDHFKAVNDEFGHETGDLVLVTVADRLRQVVRPADTVARIGGDEFVVVVEGLVGWDEQRAFAERVRVLLDEPVVVAGHGVRVGASIGVAVARPEDDARSLLREADATMYRAKARGRGRFEVSEHSAVADLGPVGS